MVGLEKFLGAAEPRRARQIALRSAVSVSLRRSQNAIYLGSGYSKSAGDVRNLHSCPERRANEICCSFGNLLNPSDLVIADGRSLTLRRCAGCCSRSGFALGTALISAIDLDGNGLEQPIKLGFARYLSEPERSLGRVTRAGDGAPIDDGDEAPGDGPSTDDEAWFCRWDPRITQRVPYEYNWRNLARPKLIPWKGARTRLRVPHRKTSTGSRTFGR